jgi:hypothetical protein
LIRTANIALFAYIGKMMRLISMFGYHFLFNLDAIRVSKGKGHNHCAPCLAPGFYESKSNNLISVG